MYSRCENFSSLYFLQRVGDIHVTLETTTMGVIDLMGYGVHAVLNTRIGSKLLAKRR